MDQLLLSGGGVVTTPSITLLLSNFRAKTVDPVWKIFFMDRCPKDGPTAKNLYPNKSPVIPEKTGKTCLGGILPCYLRVNPKSLKRHTFHLQSLVNVNTAFLILRSDHPIQDRSTAKDFFSDCCCQLMGEIQTSTHKVSFLNLINWSEMIQVK